jgi:hypothetical protein
MVSGTDKLAVQNSYPLQSLFLAFLISCSHCSVSFEERSIQSCGVSGLCVSSNGLIVDSGKYCDVIGLCISEESICFLVDNQHLSC